MKKINIFGLFTLVFYTDDFKRDMKAAVHDIKLFCKRKPSTVVIIFIWLFNAIYGFVRGDINDGLLCTIIFFLYTLSSIKDEYTNDAIEKKNLYIKYLEEYRVRIEDLVLDATTPEKLLKLQNDVKAVKIDRENR